MAAREVKLRKVCVLLAFAFVCRQCGAGSNEVKMYGKEDTNNCGMYKIKLGGVIVAEDDGSIESFFQYDCTVAFRTIADMRINVRFGSFKVPSSDPRTCGSQRLEIYDGFNSTANPLTRPSGLCSDPMVGNQSLPRPINTTTNGITIRLRRSTAPLAVFRIILTSFRNVSDGYCFPCSNNTDMCIPYGLTCDGVDNCIDGQDEDELEGPCREDIHTVVDLSKVRLMIIVGVGVVLGVGVILVATIIVVYFFWRTKTAGDEELHDDISVDSYSSEAEYGHPRLNSISSRAMYMARHTVGGHAGEDSSNYSTPVMERGNHALTNGSAIKEDNIELGDRLRSADDRRNS